MSDRREWFRERLPPAGLALMDEIERFAGLHIDVRDGTEIDPLWAGKVTTAATQVSNDGAVIYLPTGEPFTKEAGVHELLHIKMRWIDQLPQLDLRQEHDSNRRTISRITGDLEHALLIPEQRRMGFAEEARWRRNWIKLWTEYPWPDVTDPFNRRALCLLNWFLTGNWIRDPALMKMAKKAIAKEGLLNEAEAFKKTVQAALPDMAAASAHTVRYLGIFPADVWLQRIDVKARRYWYDPLPF